MDNPTENVFDTLIEALASVFTTLNQLEAIAETYDELPLSRLVIYKIKFMKRDIIDVIDKFDSRLINKELFNENVRSF